MLHGLGRDPRDVDIVVSEMTPELKSYLRPYLKKQTRFGGLEISVGQWDLDIWKLSSTWAFRERLVTPCSFEDLPKTTFLDVQAVAVGLSHSSRRPLKIVEHGFFRAVLLQTIDINFEENPFPTYCMLGALTTAYTLSFALAPRLIQYVLHYGKKTDLKEVCDYQLRKLGRIIYGRDLLKGWLDHLGAHHREDPSAPAYLPHSKICQHELPWCRAMETNALAL